jgi:gustatory receptor
LKDEVFLGYLADEIFCTEYQKRKNKQKLSANNRDILTVKEFSVSKADAVNESLFFMDKSFSVGDRLDKKLILICRMHDEICEIAKVINEMFSFHMLLTMAYSFMKITAELYFLYCNAMGQTIPFLFKSAQSFPFTVIYILYTASKTIVVIFLCWKTKTECQKTGVYLHKIANVVDENHFYNVVNHLSLKLLNQQFNFTACGFFDLDMTTLYAVRWMLDIAEDNIVEFGLFQITGAITSYLIILIQFNIAGQQNSNSTVAANATSNITDVGMRMTTVIM